MNKPLAITVILSFATAVMLQFTAHDRPQPKSILAPDTEFSAGRAIQHLHTLLAENEAHPVGSAANKRVKKRIQSILNDFAIENHIQDGFVCTDSGPTCAFVENIVGIIPGKKPQHSVVLMAHYDSVASGPGAGDDGAGVVSIIETARILKSSGPHENTIVLLFTDGEEAGLLGAKHFFYKHPRATSTKLVINLEGSGSAGESRLLRTSAQNRWLIDSFFAVSQYPTAQSLSDEVFRRMPNDTDFSIAIKAGYPGFDFAFAAERNHYHTPNDTIANLNLSTLQHHGENILPLSRHFGSYDFDAHAAGSDPARKDTVSYFTVGQTLRFSWASSRYALGLCLIFLSIALGLAWAKKIIKLSSIACAFALLTGLFMGSILFQYGSLYLLNMGQGTVVSWPADGWPRILVLAISSWAACLLGSVGLKRYTTMLATLFGLSMVLLVLSFILTVIAPMAANTLLIPTLALHFGVLIATLSAVVANRKPHLAYLANVTMGVAITAAVITTPFTLSFVIPIIDAVGHQLALAALPFLAVYTMVLTPLLAPVNTAHPEPTTTLKPLQSAKQVQVFAALATVWILAFIVAITLPLYSLSRPQHLNIHHIEEAGTKTAHWLLTSRNPLPAIDLPRLKIPQLIISPWPPLSRSRKHPVHQQFAAAPARDRPGPVLKFLSDQQKASTRILELNLYSPRNARQAFILIPENAKLIKLKIEGHTQALDVTTSVRNRYGPYHLLAIEALPKEGVSLTIELANPNQTQWIIFDQHSAKQDPLRQLQRFQSKFVTAARGGNVTLVFRRLLI